MKALIDNDSRKADKEKNIIEERQRHIIVKPFFFKKKTNSELYVMQKDNFKQDEKK